MVFKNMRCVTLLFISLFAGTMYAQEIKGVVTYQTKTTMDMSRFSRDGQQMSEQRKKQIMERMKNFLEKEFTLTFTNNESFYKEEEKLATPGQGGGGGRFGGGFTQGGIYKNIDQNAYAQENNMFGKVFLIKDTINNLEWELVKESKMIGQYPVFKAVATRNIEQNLFSRLGRRGRGNQRENEKKSDSLDTASTEDKVAEKPEPKTETIIAWYTPMIPANHGPGEFGGLPGLILELNTSNTTILCTKVVLNPKEEIAIEVPEKGKEVTKAEYQKIVDEKAQEMSERYGGQNRRGGGGGRRGRSGG